MPATAISKFPADLERWQKAMLLASTLHRDDTRKGTAIPYISHLLQVAGLVLEAGGDDDLAIAALLHDTLEDHGDKITSEDIERDFGPRVAKIVKDCSDAVVSATKPKKAPWRERKEVYLSRICEKSPDSLLVSTADKVHNARSIADDYERHGEELWARFNGGKDGTQWYYLSTAESFQASVAE